MMGIMFQGTTSGSASSISTGVRQRGALVSSRAIQMPSGNCTESTIAENRRLRSRLPQKREERMSSLYQSSPTQCRFCRVKMSWKE